MVTLYVIVFPYFAARDRVSRYMVGLHWLLERVWDKSLFRYESQDRYLSQNEMSTNLQVMSRVFPCAYPKKDCILDPWPVDICIHFMIAIALYSSIEHGLDVLGNSISALALKFTKKYNWDVKQEIRAQGLLQNSAPFIWLNSRSKPQRAECHLNPIFTSGHWTLSGRLMSALLCRGVAR